jgi:hypothetical protein
MSSWTVSVQSTALSRCEGLWLSRAESNLSPASSLEALWSQARSHHKHIGKCLRPMERSRSMLVETFTAGRSPLGHRVLAEAAGRVEGKSGLGADQGRVLLREMMSKGPWAEPAEGVCVHRLTLGRTPLHKQPALGVRTAFPTSKSSSLDQSPLQPGQERKTWR